MVQPLSNIQASPQVKPGRPKGKFITILLIVAFCAPLGGYTHWLNDRYASTVSLAELTLVELFFAALFLILPFIVLKVLRINWQSERSAQIIE